MLELTVLCDDGTRQVSAHVELGHVLVDETDLPAAIGWTLKPEGLCRADVCVPVRDPNRMRVGHRLDLGEVVAALDRPWVADLDAGIAALGAARSERRRAIRDLELPTFELPDLDGAIHSLEEWRGRRKLLVVFASW